MDIFTLILFPLLTNLRFYLRTTLVLSIKCFIICVKNVDLEAPVIIESSSEVDGDSNIEQLITVFIIVFTNILFQ